MIACSNAIWAALLTWIPLSSLSRCSQLNACLLLLHCASWVVYLDRDIFLHRCCCALSVMECRFCKAGRSVAHSSTLEHVPLRHPLRRGKDKCPRTTRTLATIVLALVQGKMAEYLNRLAQLGVAGVRVDAAKHVNSWDMGSILQVLCYFCLIHTRPSLIQDRGMIFADCEPQSPS